MASSDSEEQIKDVCIDSIASKLQGKVVISVDTIDWEDAGKNLKNAVLFRLSLGRSIPKKPLEDILVRAWRLEKPCKFWKVDRDYLLVNFDSEKDQVTVLDGGPWCFEGSALLMQKWVPGMTEEDFDNTKLNVWVQVRRLPFEFRCHKFAKGIAKCAGDLVKMEGMVDSDVPDFGNQYVRVRVQIDHTKPLVNGCFLKRPDRKPVWICFKYERLPSFCYNCGSLNHDTKSCRIQKENKIKLFGSWLRAEDPEVYTVQWLDEMEKGDRFTVLAMPEEMTNRSESMKSPGNGNLVEQVREAGRVDEPSYMFDDVSNLVTPITAVALLPKQVEDNGKGLGGWEYNGH